MTITELIATKLLGWRGRTEEENQAQSITLQDNERCKWVNLNCYIGKGPWPRFDDWNDIRRMEDALAERGMLGKYLDVLIPDGQEVYALEIVSRATTTHRVAAAIKVLQEVEL